MTNHDSGIEPMNAKDSASAHPGRSSALSGGRTRRAKAKLKAACDEVDADPRFASDPERHLEARILAKLTRYRSWIAENDLRPSLDPYGINGGLVLRHIGHGGAEMTPSIRAALHDLNDLVPEGDCVRQLGDEPVDLLVQAFGEEMKENKFNLPRTGATGRYHWRKVCDRVGCKDKQMTERRKAYLRAIDAKVEGTREVVHVPLTGWDRTERNRAVPTLLAAGLKRLHGAMPADPLQPLMIDVAEVADECGVTVRDITGGPLEPEMRAAMEEARDGKPLVPHPLLAQRRFTYRELKEAGRAAHELKAKKDEVADPAAAARIAVRALTQFLSLPELGGRTEDIVPLDFEKRVRRAVAGRPTQFGSGFASQMIRWIGYYHAHRSSKPLPRNFASAIKILAVEAEVSRYQIIKIVGNRALSWVQGTTFPSLEAKKHVLELERLLKLDAETLTGILSPEWQARRIALNLTKHGLSGVSRNLPADIVGKSLDEQLAIATEKWSRHVRQPTEYARRLSQQLRDRYRLAFDDWPVVMQAAWETQIPKVSEEVPRTDGTLRLPGDRPTRQQRVDAKKDADRRWRSKTKEMGEKRLSLLFGYLVRGRATEDETREEGHAEPKDFIPEGGLGMPVDLIHPALFAVVDLLAGYTHWRRRRSGGRFSPAVTATLARAADFLRPETGLVWRNSSYLRHIERFKEWWDESGATLAEGHLVLDIEAFREDWQTAVENAYTFMLEDMMEMRTNDPKRIKLRLPFVPIAGYLEANDPMVPYMKGVRHMLKSTPLQMVDRHRHARNCILTLILVQTGLRAATLLLTVAGPDPTLRREVGENGVVRWRIVIPAVRFKNFKSPYFANGQPYDLVLDDEDDLYERLDDYMARSRPYLLNGGTSDALFITSGGKDYSAAKLSNTYRLLTGKFFVHNDDRDTGFKDVLPHGLHAVRHIIATSLLRTTGDIYVAAWAIQDTAATVEQHYVDFLPRNKALLAVEHLRKSRVA